MGTKRRTARKASASVSRTKDTSRSGTSKRAATKTLVEATDFDSNAKRLVVYVHGIGNKPRESALKLLWDKALFGINLGDRSRMAYWVNRERYPFAEPDSFSEMDLAGADAVRAKAVRSRASAEPPDFRDEIAELTRNKARQEILVKMAKRMAAAPRMGTASHGIRTASFGKKVLPLGDHGRAIIADWLTNAWLKDVHDYLFDESERVRMCTTFAQRLTAGAGPFVVVAHSQGTMIAYKALLELAQQRPDLDIPLFVTMGSPLGMQEVVDQFRKWTRLRNGKLPRPACVRRWINIADRLDPVAIDNSLAHDYDLGSGAEEEHGFAVNPDWMRNPHCATGYLSTGFVRERVKDALGPGFAQQVHSFVVAQDLHADLADAPEERHPVLIELASSSSGDTDMEATRHSIEARIEKLVAAKRKTNPTLDPEVEILRRFVAARLTRAEVEVLHAEYGNLKIDRVWRNSVKRALICESVNTIHASTAQRGYSAMGRDIEWAVLDTGVKAEHPHFAELNTIATEWDCTARGPLRSGARRGHPADDRDGHGTHVCGIIAGQFPRGLRCKQRPDAPPVKFCGMAPEPKLHVYKVLNDHGEGQDSWIIKALDHIAALNERSGRLRIHGVNLSLGGPSSPDVFGCGHTPLCEELRRLWRQGVVVCVSAGNEGYAVLKSSDGDVEANMDLSIGDPANLDDCIAVGSVHKSNPHTYGVSYFSSRGPTADGRRKPEVVAPGERVLSALHCYRALQTKEEWLEDYFVEMGGTSMACPHISGLIAAFLSVRREFIGYPDRVKRILLDNCTDLGRDPYIQGYGLPNLTKMLLNT